MLNTPATHNMPRRAAAVLLLLVATFPAWASMQGPALVGPGNQPFDFNQSLAQVRASADGRFVVFMSRVNLPTVNLSDGFTETANFNVYMRDMQTGQLKLISINSAGDAPGNGSSSDPVISDDGRFIVFTSTSTDLVAGSTTAGGIFVYDSQTGANSLIAANGARPFISANGRTVVFHRSVSNTFFYKDLFAYDIQTRATELVTPSHTGGESDGRSQLPQYENFYAQTNIVRSRKIISDDGRFVVFASLATNLVSLPDTNDGFDVFVRDLQTDTTTLVTVNSAGTDTSRYIYGERFDTFGAAISGDGRLVAFSSRANDLAAGTPPGSYELFVRDLAAGTTEVASVRTAPPTTNSYTSSGNPSFSRDGRYLAFQSHANDIAPNDNSRSDGQDGDIFVRDLQADTTTLVSVNSAGTGSGSSPSERPQISANGRFVTFLSGSTNLDAGGISSTGGDVFVRDLQTGVTRLVSVNSTGTAGAGVSYAPSITADGEMVFFESFSENLVTKGERFTSNYAYAGYISEFFAALTAPPSRLSFEAARYDVTEANGSVTVTVTRNGATDAAITADYTTQGGRARAGRDYTATSGTLTFAPGETTKTITIPILDNNVDSADDSFFVYLNDFNYGPVPTVLSTTMVVVTDNDELPTLSIFDTSANEGDTGLTSYTVTATLSAPSAQRVTFSMQTSEENGSATLGVDFQRTFSGAGSIHGTFEPGETTKTFTATEGTLIIADQNFETDETFSLILRTMTNAQPGVTQAVVTIRNDDPFPTVSAASTTVSEGNSGTTEATLTVQLSSPSAQTITVNYATADDTAVAGSDYTAASGSLTFAPGELSKTVKVLVAGDTIDEINEAFKFILSNATNATISASQPTVTIIDDDGPNITVNDISVLEGESGVKNATFTLTLSAVSPQNVGVSYSTGGGTATPGNDYTAVTNGFVEVPAGQISATFNLQIIGDFNLEPDEMFNVTLGNASGGTVTDPVGVCTILNDDAAGTLQFSAGSYSVGENSTATVSVRRVGGRSGIVSVTFSTADGTAGAGSDYTAVTQTLTFGDGDSGIQEITIPLIDDLVSEGPETINLSLSNPTNGAILGNPSAIVLTIQDNEPACTYSISPPNKTSPAGGETTTVSVTTQAGCGWTAVSNSNFISITSGASGAGSGSAALNISANNSGVPRTGTVTIAGQTFTVTQPELTPEVPTVQFGTANYSIGESEGLATVTVTRTGGSAQAVSVDYRTADADTFTVSCADTTNNNGGAFARCDFATTVGRLNFAAGEVQKTLTVPIINDGHDEGTENFQLVLSNPVGVVTLGTTSTTTITIQDNDEAGAPNPVTTSHPFFVRQQYLDFLSREPDTDGFNAWLGLLNGCPNAFAEPSTPSRCDRIYVSGEGFFRSQEFQLKGFYVFRFYRLAFNRLPDYTEIISDMSFVAGQTAEEVYARKAQLPTLFTQRAEFQAAYDGMTNAQYVSVLMSRYNLQQITTPDPANPDGSVKVILTKDDLINRLNANTMTRGQVLRAVADSDAIGTAEFNNAFVGMQYYGYLRRKPDTEGFNAWLNVLQSGDVRTMVNGFLNSTEYKLRFGQP